MSADRSLRWIVLALAALGALALAVERLWLAAVQPLWFDEAWSLAVATAPDWRSVLHEARIDSNAPLSYLLLHAWTSIAGPSDLALRLPGLIAVAAAALLPLARPIEGLDRQGRLTWAAMLFAWWGVDVFLAGRGYGLLLALSVAQVLLFAHLIAAPTLRRAIGWAVVAALAILTHYYALIGAGVQGLVFLAVHRRAVLRCWPAALAFVPAGGWLAWHWPRLQAFAAPATAWHALVGPREALAMSAFTLNPSAPLVGLAAALVLAAAALLITRGAVPRHLGIAAGAALAALALTLLSGALRPSLTARYLIPEAPGLLLGLVLCARALPWPRLAQALLALVWTATALRPAAFAEGLKSQSPYGFETASDLLMQHGVTDVVFAWDHEVTGLMPPATLQRMGGVFFRRAGAPIRVHPLTPRPGEDLNATAPAAAQGPRPGIIWIYNTAGRTAAAIHPPGPPAPGWTCRTIGDATSGSRACWRDLR